MEGWRVACGEGRILSGPQKEAKKREATYVNSDMHLSYFSSLVIPAYQLSRMAVVVLCWCLVVTMRNFSW